MNLKRRHGTRRADPEGEHGKGDQDAPAIGEGARGHEAPAIEGEGTAMVRARSSMLCILCKVASPSLPPFFRFRRIRAGDRERRVDSSMGPIHKVTELMGR